MKSFRQICLQPKHSSQRTSLNSLNSSKRSSSLTQSFRNILSKQLPSQPHPLRNISNQNINPNITLTTDTQLFTKLIKQSKFNSTSQNPTSSQPPRYQTQPNTNPPLKPFVKSIKKKIKINRRLPLDTHIHTPIRDMKERIKQQRTTAIELTSTEKKQIESDLSRVTEKIKERLIQKEFNQQEEIQSVLKQVEKDIKGETERAFERVIGKRDCILSSIKSKKGKGEGEGRISTPRFEDGSGEKEGEQPQNTDRFENSLLHTIEEVLNKITIEPLKSDEKSKVLKSGKSGLGKKQSERNLLSRMYMNNDKFSTKSIKNRLVLPTGLSSNQSSLLL